MAARRDREARFTSLMHHITPERLRSAYQAINPKATAGVDGMTWDAYGQDLDTRIQDLHDRVQRGGYRVSPSRRAYIPKADGSTRPLGVSTLEDKIVQRALAEVLNAIYEVDFLGFSYGFRPGRNPHQALDAVTVAIESRKVNWVLDADIRGFFDALDHDRLEALIGHRIGDPRVLRLIHKMLIAGVMEEGEWRESDRGSPQGASLSPLLANIYLHYTLDVWAHAWRQSEARGEVYLVRFADDFLVCFQYKDDAQRFQTTLARRLAEFSLELHTTKTRLIEFGRFAAKNRQDRGEGKPETFDFLGFTHMCSRTREGKFAVRRKSMRKRMAAKLRSIREQLMLIRHAPIRAQGHWLRSVVQGWFNYHAVPWNSTTLKRFRDAVCRAWVRALRRRGQKHRLTWSRFARQCKPYLPAPRILHPWPAARFAMRLTQGRSPVR
jgi:group II intron reverse transcriptase/maturase